MDTTAFFSGSFEIPTNGHMAIWAELLNGFDNLVIGIGENPKKQENTKLFSAFDSQEMIEEALQDWITAYEMRGINGRIFSTAEKNAVLKYKSNPRCIKIYPYSASSVLAAKRVNATHFVRSERITGDHDSEMSLAAANRLIDETAAAGLCYLTIPLPRAELTFTSTSAAKDFCGINQFIAAGNLVSPSVHNRMMQKYLAPVFMELGYHKGLAKKQCEETYSRLAKKYISRKYHNFSHIAYCLNLLDNYLPGYSEIRQNLMLGFFFHDEYQNYEPEAKNNNAEILSAQSCADFIAGSKYKKTNFGFLELIIGQRRPETASKEARIFADIDYAILGDMYNYGTYAMQIRREYKQFNDDEFRKGRIDFIESLLKQPRIYQTDYFYKLREENARINLQRELGWWLVQEKFA